MRWRLRFRLASPAFHRAPQPRRVRRMAGRAKLLYVVAAYAVVVCARVVCARVASARVRDPRLSREVLLAQALARKQVPARMPSQWPACWLVPGASRVQRPVRKSVGELAQIPRRAGEPVEEMAQIPRRVREPVPEAAWLQSPVRELALAQEAQNPRGPLLAGRAQELSPAPLRARQPA